MDHILLWVFPHNKCVWSVCSVPTGHQSAVYLIYRHAIRRKYRFVFRARNMFEDTKEVIWSHHSKKDRRYKGKIRTKGQTITYKCTTRGKKEQFECHRKPYIKEGQTIQYIKEKEQFEGHRRPRRTDNKICKRKRTVWRSSEAVNQKGQTMQ